MFEINLDIQFKKFIAKYKVNLNFVDSPINDVDKLLNITQIDNFEYLY